MWYDKYLVQCQSGIQNLNNVMLSGDERLTQHNLSSPFQANLTVQYTKVIDISLYLNDKYVLPIILILVTIDTDRIRKILMIRLKRKSPDTDKKECAMRLLILYK